LENASVDKRRVVLTLVGLGITLGFAALPTSKWENEFAGTWHLVGYEIIWWAVAAVVLLHVHLLEGRRMESIGFRKPGIRDVLIGAAGGIVTLAGLAAIYYVLFPALHFNEEQQVNQLLATPFWWRFISVVRAAVAEEVLLRGYAIERLEQLTGISFAGGVSCAIFALEHAGPWGWPHVIIAGFGGISLTLLYIWRRNLWVSIIAHFIIDGTSVLLA
jgi:membrane protease YdiL (CAAX protease family)